MLSWREIRCQLYKHRHDDNEKRGRGDFEDKHCDRWEQAWGEYLHDVIYLLQHQWKHLEEIRSANFRQETRRRRR